MTKIVVIGGTGLIGSRLVARLTEHGHEAIAASPSSGVNALTGEGLADVLEGAQVLVDVSNSPSWEEKAVLDFFTTATTNLIAAAKKAGVSHYVALSIVGTERLQDNPYFRAKIAQEKLIGASGLPYSIVRATQFFDFVGVIADVATAGGQTHISHVLFQPIAADDVAIAMARAAVGEPTNGISEIAGPERVHMDELVRTSFAATGDQREVVIDPGNLYNGAPVSEHTLVPGDGAVIFETRFEDWLAAQAAK